MTSSRTIATIASLCALCWACDGADEHTRADAGPADASSAPDTSPDAPTLRAEAGEPRHANLGEPLTLDGGASVGATAYLWSFGDGAAWDTPRPEPTARHTWRQPGRYQAVLTVFDAAGRSRSDSVTVSVTPRPTFTPAQSSSVIARSTGGAAVVSPDSDELVLAASTDDGFTIEQRIPTCDTPRTVAEVDSRYAVACQAADAVWVHDPRGGAVLKADLGWGARPFGAIAVDRTLFVALQGPGQVAVLHLDDAQDARLPVAATLDALEDARDLARLPDGRLAVTRWRSPTTRGELALLDPAGVEPPQLISLAVDEQAASDTETGGVPTYLSGVAVSPLGDLAAVPSLQANIGQGPFLNGEPLTHQFTLRAALSFVDLTPADTRERPDSRKLFDDRGLASAATFSPRGDYLFAAMRGSRIIERYDVLSRVESGSLIDVGFAPNGLAVSADGEHLFVDSYLSRELAVYAIDAFNAFVQQPIARLRIPSSEPLSPQLLRGKQLFNDSFDLRLTKDAYIACAHCHLDGEADRQTWDFTGRGEGLRNTTSLLGRAGMGDGPLHWSGNFDEVHDFENDIRFEFEGAGLMDDADFARGTRADPLGDPKAGLSDDLDALAAYVTSLTDTPRSPHRAPDGSLTLPAQRGQAIFESDQAGCTGCHSGARLTDSAFLSDGSPRLHDVGTLSAGSGRRLGGPLDGIDTPTLHGAWNSAPYLHDGSAASLREVLVGRNPDARHGTTSHLDDAQINDLIAYLLSLDGRRD